MALRFSAKQRKTNDPSAHGGHRARIPDRVLAVFEAGAQEGASEVPFHLLQLRADEVDRDDFLLGKHVPYSASVITVDYEDAHTFPPRASRYHVFCYWIELHV